MHAPLRALTLLALLTAMSGCSLDHAGRGHASSVDDITTDGGDPTVLDGATAPTDAASAEPVRDAATDDAATTQVPRDAGADAALDAGEVLDAGDAPDAGALDAGLDAGAPPDAGSDLDAGAAVDAGAADAATAEDAGGMVGDAGADDPAPCPGRERVGDVRIRTADDLATLAGVVCIRGNLSIVHDVLDGTAPPTGPMRDLRIVFGDVSYYVADWTEPPSAPQLTRIEGTLSLRTRLPVALPALVQTRGLSMSGPLAHPSAVIELTALRDVLGDVATPIANEVGTIRLPALERVTGALKLTYALALTELSVPQLRVVQGPLRVEFASSIEALRFPALEHAESVNITSSASGSLRTLDLSALVEVPGRLGIDARMAETLELSHLRQADTLAITYPSRLRSLDLPALVRVRRLLLMKGPLLSSLSLPSLTSVEMGSISDCPRLSECVVAAINAQLAPGSGRIRGAGLRSDPSCAVP